MYRIGLTGGVGSGKSTVSSYMKEFGIPVIDGDRLAVEAVMPGSAAMKEMQKVFSKEIFNEDGSLNRVKTAEIVFNDEEKRKAINEIIHPYVWRRTQAEVLAAQENGHHVVVLDMPLLLEISWQLRVEAVWVVQVPLEIQIERVMARNGFTRQQVLERIQKQMPTENKLSYADVIIDNSRSPEYMKKQVREALSHIPEFVFPKRQDGRYEEI